MAPKKPHQRAMHRAELNGTATHKGRTMSLAALGGSSRKASLAPKVPSATRKQRASQHIKFLSWNPGGLTSGAWEELLSQLSTPDYEDVSLVILQETHWRGVSQFTRDCWHFISSGSNGEKGAGVAVLATKMLCQAQSIRYTEVMPGRILHVRIPGERFSLHVISVYQFVWCSSTTAERRAVLQRNASQSRISQ